MATWQDFNSASRRQLALVLRERPRTQREAAEAMGRSTPSVAKLFHRMYADGLLVADPAPPTRGSVYALSAEAELVLDEALTRPPSRTETTGGRLEAQSRLLLVEGTDDIPALNRILADPQLTSDVAWVAETDTRGGLLLAMAPHTPSAHVQRLFAVLMDSGIRCVRLHLGEIQSADEMRDQAAVVNAAFEASP